MAYRNANRRDRSPTIWSDQEVRVLREAIQEESNPWHARLLDLILATGLRSREAETLTLADLDPDGWVQVRNGKGGRDRRAYALDREDGIVSTWIEKAREEGRDLNDEVYPCAHPTFYLALDRAGERAGIQHEQYDPEEREVWYKYVHPHAARSTWVRLAREAGYGWELIAKLGWGSVKSLPMVMEHYYEVDLERQLDGQTTAYQLPATP